MKKLILAFAVAAASVIASAAVNTCSTCNTCDTCTTCGKPCGWGYRIKVLLKTTATNSKAKVAQTSCCSCTTCPSVCYRKPATKRYLGYVFGVTNKANTCSPCECNCWKRFNLVLWDYDSKQPIPVRTLAVLQWNRFGEAKGSMVETAVRLANTAYLADGVTPEFPFDLQFAGLGDIGIRTDKTPAIKRVSGFCAGIIPSFCQDVTKTCCETLRGPAKRSTIFTLCYGGSGCTSCSTGDCDMALYSCTTAAYGKWVMAWDSAIVNRITKGAIKFVEAAPVTDDDDPTFGFMAIDGYIPSRFSSAYRFFGAIDKTIEEGELTVTTKAYLNGLELGEDSGDAEAPAEGIIWAADQALVADFS